MLSPYNVPVKYDAAYMLPIDVVPSITTNGATFWTMRNNTSGKRMFITHINVATTYNGNDAISRTRYDWFRFSAATPTGGTSLSAIKKDSNYGSSNLLDARVNNAGLTTTGVTFESQAFWHMDCPSRYTSCTWNIRFNVGGEQDYIVLNPGEGIAIRFGSTGVSGNAMRGFIGWFERD